MILGVALSTSLAVMGLLTGSVTLVAFVIDRVMPRLGNFPLLKTRREARRLMASGLHVDYAGRWRYGLGERSTVLRDATSAELRYLGITPGEIDGHREIMGGL